MIVCDSRRAKMKRYRLQALELKIPPAVLILVTAAAMYVSRNLGVLVGIPNSIKVITFALFFGLACVCLFGSTWTFIHKKTTLDPRIPADTSILIVEGLFRFTRNPIYLGFCCLLLAFAIWLSNWVSLVWVAVFAIYLTNFQIIPEERYLLAKFGQDYSRYCEQVNRWI
jgi:protein-S-isoprenylcysteine O-methyltransferase Ste14